MKHLFFALIIPITLFSCNHVEQTKSPNPDQTQQKDISKKTYTSEQQDSIVTVYYENGALNYHLYSQGWQKELDKGLAVDSTIAYLWQQKAMPLFKQGKYELGMTYIDKAVEYDRLEYQEYRAFIKCIFAKTYQAAIDDFEDCKSRFGNSYVMDHTYNFHIALSKLQLNEFEEAEKILEEDILTEEKKHNEEWTHHLDLFYLGISRFEQQKYHEAIEAFDRALIKYPEFSDVQYYKAICLSKIDKNDEATLLYQKALVNGKNGYTINEDNVIYEKYPYQIRWELM